jgi:hypothetical protein
MSSPEEMETKPKVEVKKPHKDFAKHKWLSEE